MQAATGAFLVVVGHPLDYEENHISEPRINDRIRVPEVRLVGPNGEQVGIVRVEDALRLAAEADLDLVEVAPNARPPVCKLMDFGKFKYESAMKEREARRNQTNTVIKEIKLRPKIDPHDYGTKKGHVERFLKAGDKVKVTIMFRGREQSRPELGFRLLQKLAEDIGELGFVESTPKQDGRNMIMVIGPTRKKAEAKAEERRRREQAAAQRSAPAAETGTEAPANETPVTATAVNSAPETATAVNDAPETVPTTPVSAPTAPAPVAEIPVAELSGRRGCAGRRGRGRGRARAGSRASPRPNGRVGHAGSSQAVGARQEGRRQEGDPGQEGAPAKPAGTATSATPATATKTASPAAKATAKKAAVES